MSGATVPGIYGTIPPIELSEGDLVRAHITAYTDDSTVQREIAAALGIGGGR